MTNQVFVGVSADQRLVEERLERLRAEGVRATVGELVGFELARLLGDFPELCQRRDADGSFRAHAVDLSVALNIARKGVRHPVIRSADTLSLEEVAVAFKELSLRYFRGELSDADCEGGAVTVSDMSSFKVTTMIPPIRDPEGASLGICAPMPGCGAFQLAFHCDSSLADCATVAAMLGGLTARIEGR